MRTQLEQSIINIGSVKDRSFKGRKSVALNNDFNHARTAAISEMEQLVGGYRRKKFSEKIKRTDPYLRKVYAEIVEHTTANKMKPEKMKVQKQQIIKYLRKRFN